MDVVYGSFIWDDKKETKNTSKHGVSFAVAARVFLDEKRKIFKDSKHDKFEERLFCIGKVDNHIITVRFTYRGDKIRIIGAGFWRKGRQYYEKEK